nr:K176 [uncultured bacterium]
MNHSVKDYLQHLDDMENGKGQQEERRFRLEIFKRSYGSKPASSGTGSPRRLT